MELQEATTQSGSPVEKRTWICPTIELISKNSIQSGIRLDRPETTTIPPGIILPMYGTLS